MNPDAHSTISDSTTSPFPKKEPDAVNATDEYLDALSSSIVSEAAAAPVSPCLSELYLLSPPQRNPSNSSSKRTQLIRASLTPPPHSEKINRAIRAAEFQLDAAVYDVHRYISRGCSDGDRGDVPRAFSGSPESDYSDDLLSPRVFPDFPSPITGTVGNEISDSFSKTSYRRRILDDVDDEGNDAESRSSDACDLGEVAPKLQPESNKILSVENENPNVSADTCGNNKSNQQNQDMNDGKSNKGTRRDMRTESSISRNMTHHINSETMELRTLQLVEGKFQVWPPLKSAGLLPFA